MSLRRCPPIESNIQSVPMTTVRRPIAVILCWMFAKNSHIDKFRELWFRRGFDVLTVRISPKDFLLPPIGSKVIATNLVNYLNQISPKYDEIVIHAFSVGVYQYGEMLLKLRSSHEYKCVCNSLKGVIIDSMVGVDIAAHGLSRAITTNIVMQSVLKACFEAYFTLTKTITIQNYRQSYREIYENFLGLPGI